MKKMMILVFTMLVFGFVQVVCASDLSWNDPGAEWANITGYTVHFTGDSQDYNQNVTTAELTREGGQVIYNSFEVNLNFQYGVEYAVYITAYNNSGESGPSNTVVYTREGYVPPFPSLPAGEVVSTPQSPGGLTF